MATDADVTLLDRVDALLVERGVSHVFIGAIALAAHGLGLPAADRDVLVTDRRVLEPQFWDALRPAASVDVRAGDGDDPLPRLVRLRGQDEGKVDVVVGRHPWQDDVLGRAVFIRGEGLPVADAADVILLKLYAGGSQDRSDIERLLAIDDRGELARKVEERSAVLPLRSRKMWLTLRPPQPRV